MGGATFRESLTRGPRWVTAALAGTIFGVGMFGFQQARDGSDVVVSALTSVVAAVFFGVLMGRRMHRLKERQQAAMGDTPVARRREVNRAAMRGPVPSDPAMRRAALAVVAYQLELYRRQRWAIFMWLFCLALSLWLFISDGGWQILSVLLFAGFLTLQLWMPRHLRKRRLLLADDAAVT